LKTLLDLYSGAGCFSEGFKEAGYNPVLGIDNWDKAVSSYRANFKESLLADITKLDMAILPKVDVVIGSPPCQDWSKGKNEKRTFEMQYIKAFMKIVKFLNPKYWIWECAPETAKIDNASILNAVDYGVPQIRKRAFHCNFKLPEPKEQGKNLNELFGWKETKVLFNHRSLNENAFSPVYLSNRPARTVVTWPIRIYKEDPFTVDMMKQVQTIPKDFILCGNKQDQYTQIGNAVPCKLAYYIAKELKW
jgi:DNA (cytosine-5)-methyltransferase 1